MQVLDQTSWRLWVRALHLYRPGTLWSHFAQLYQMFRVPQYHLNPQTAIQNSYWTKILASQKHHAQGHQTLKYLGPGLWQGQYRTSHCRFRAGRVRRLQRIRLHQMRNSRICSPWSNQLEQRLKHLNQIHQILWHFFSRSHLPHLVISLSI